MKNKFNFIKSFANSSFGLYLLVEFLITIRRSSLAIMILGSFTHYLDNRKYVYILLALIWILSSMLIRLLKLRTNKAS